MVSATIDNRRTLEAIKYTSGSLSILDQLALPHETKYVSVIIDG
jgi:methylthioribose-1-phosphate isomerase